MAPAIVHTHSYRHFSDLQLSAQTFYSELNEAILSYEHPGVVCGVGPLGEGGWFSAQREYMRIKKGRYHYYVCAAPFGRSFFISWWLEEQDTFLIAFIASIPFIGRWLAGKTRAKTFFEMDSELMFTESIQFHIKAAVAKLMAEHGFRNPDLVTAERNAEA